MCESIIVTHYRQAEINRKAQLARGLELKLFFMHLSPVVSKKSINSQILIQQCVRWFGYQRLTSMKI